MPLLLTVPPFPTRANLLLLALLAVGPARGQDTLPLPLTGPLATPQDSLLMLDRDGDVLPMLAPRVSLLLSGGHSVLEGTQGQRTVARVDDSLVAAVGGALGFGVADLGFVLPVHLLLAGERQGESWQATRLGDLAVVPRASPFPLDDTPLNLVLSVPVTFPTGDEDDLAGRAGFTAEPRLRVTVHASRFHLAVRPGVLLQGGAELTTPELSTWLTLRSAVGLGIGPEQRVRAELGLDGVLPLGDRSLTSAELLFGVVVRPAGGLSLSIHGGLGAGPMPGTAAARLAVGVAWEGQSK